MFAKKPKIATLNDKLTHYRLLRSIAQDAVDAAEKWASIVEKTTGRRPQSIDKKTRATAHVMAHAELLNIFVNLAEIDLLIESAVGNNLTVESEIPPMLRDFGQIFNEEDDNLEQ